MIARVSNAAVSNGAVAQKPVRSEAAVKSATSLYEKVKAFFVDGLDTPSSGSHLRYAPIAQEVLEMRAEANRNIGRQLAA